MKLMDTKYVKFSYCIESGQPFDKKIYYDKLYSIVNNPKLAAIL